VHKVANLTASLLTAAIVAVTAPAGALAAPAPATSGSADFAVSTPAEPLKAGSDGLVHTTLTVSDNGVNPLTVKLRSVGVVPLDDGKMRIDDQADRVWSKTITMAPQVRLGAGSYQRVPVTIKMPTGLLPDLYTLGFVAEAQPINPAAPVLVYNQIAYLITVEVAGARERRLALDLAPVNWFHIGSALDGTYKVRNVGSAAARGRGQVVVDSPFGRKNVAVVQNTDGMQLYPTGTSRGLNYRYLVHGFFLLARPEAQVLYGNGTSTLQSVTERGHLVLVIPWITIILLGALATGLTAYLYWKHRRRNARRRDERPAHRAAGRGRHACAG
jgi:hypothetical protein